MDPLAIIVRAVVAYVILHVLVRASGKRTLRQGTLFDFTIALVVGDIVDNFVFGESSAGQFVVASAVLLGTHAVMCIVRYRVDSGAA